MDGISSPERKRREALEYEEDDEPDPIVEEEVLEASAQIPNIPVPRSTDGNVSVLHYRTAYPLWAQRNLTMLTRPLLALGHPYTQFHQGRLKAVSP